MKYIDLANERTHVRDSNIGFIARLTTPQTSCAYYYFNIAFTMTIHSCKCLK